ncbi:Gaa1-like protein [Crucibulum laeve]|uniref:Gaa1-like protein n=1 Tax=Crucibulum laeve TaxID=68775 RepID=A0A5C3MBZ4_9AGAR|nr:Gaa1-like protein [Crucibulum laeve]
MEAEEANQGPRWKQSISRLRQKFKGGANANVARLRRRKAMISSLTRRLPFFKFALFVVGYIWMLAIPSPRLGRGTYIDENALQPSQVNTYWNWGDVHAADRYLEQLEALRDVNSTSEQRAHFLETEFKKLGLPASTQNYNFSSSAGLITGTNAYALLGSPRGAGTEAMVISASWLSRTGEGDGTLNLRGISTVLALAGFLKRYSLWAKDIVFVISDGYLDGMHAWLSEYHGSTHKNLQSDPVELTSGVIWTALNIDYPGHSFSHLGVFFEGLNGRLPNQDLLNSFQRISRNTGHVPVTVYDHIDPREAPQKVEGLVSNLPKILQDNPEIQAFSYQAKNVARHIGYQARGRASGVHGLFHEYRIDAITIFAIPATGPHGFHAIGRIVESTLRTMNNLLERLHASFFFFILTDHDRFMKIGNYLPSAVLISIAMMIQGLQTWVRAGWKGEDETKLNEKQDGSSGVTPTQQPKRRPVGRALAIMTVAHLVGLVVFTALTQRLFIENIQLLAPIMFILLATIPFIMANTIGDTGPLSLVLKSFNLCLASTVISIITVLNFSLASSLAVFLGIPLSITSSSSSILTRVIKTALYSMLGFGWLLLGHREILSAVHDWEVLQVWFAPFVCLVYVPLALQALTVCVL